MRATVEEFGRRTDVWPQAFGFRVQETPDGPRYEWEGPSGRKRSSSCVVRASSTRITSSSRSVAAGGEGDSMAQTEQAWDWGVDLRDEERAELELLRATVPQLRTELDQAQEALRGCGQRHEEASQALRQLAETRFWGRRRVLAALRQRQLL
jgi:hypothetical protein